MTSAPASPAIELEVRRIRELSKEQRHAEALTAAEALAAMAPDHRDALYLTAANQRCLNRLQDALATLQRLEQVHPRFSLLYQERGYCWTSLRDAPRAMEAFAKAVTLNPALTASWTMLERMSRMTGERECAEEAAGQISMLKKLPPEVVQAGSLFADGDLDAAEKILTEYACRGKSHREALRLLARIEHQRNEMEMAERLLEAALKVAPGYEAARVDSVRVLLDGQKYPEALDAADALLSLAPGKTDSLSLRATALTGLGRHEEAIALYQQLLATSAESAELRVALGHALQSIGRQQDAIDCYQTAAAMRPGFGDAWWSLANLQSYRFSDDEIARMRAAEAAPNAGAVDRCHLCFALGKAYEDRKEYAESWQFYERGNALKRSESCYRPEFVEAEWRRQMEVCTARFFAERADYGVADADAIFVVGLPRSGSTLVEQILASHSQIEGTQELPEIPRMVREMEGLRANPVNPRYPRVLADLTPNDFRWLGERYLAATRAYRGNRPFFIDKMPNNFRHIGLIHLMLPNAAIVDVRREPMACCFSNLKQLFASGQEFTYSIEDIARYYRTYLERMRHWDEVLPGRVLRAEYEDLVDDLEGNVRRILEHCGVEFEPACVEFHKTQRSVRTASSEQVRKPVFRDGLDQWRNYESWLEPLKDALGDALHRYRE
jgi:tetratricopeptide (TPR) repeat protein